MMVALSPVGLAAPVDESNERLPAHVSLDDALRIFRSKSFDLLLADAAIAGAEGDVKAAAAIPNPSFSGGLYRSFFSETPVPLFETNLGWFVGVGDANAIEDTLSGKRGLRSRVAQAALRAVRLSRADAERLLEFQVKQQYIQAVEAQDALDFATEVQTSSARTFELTHVRRTAGAISEADEAKVEVAKLEAEQAVRAARQAVAVAKTGLAFLLGAREDAATFEVDQDLPKFVVPPRLAAATVPGMMREALDGRPDLRAAGAQRERAAGAAALARRLRFPDLSLNLQYSQEGSASGKVSPAQTGIPQSAISPITPPTVELSIAGTLPFLYQQQGEIRKSDADLQAQEVQATKVAALVAADVRTAFENYTAARELVERMQQRLLERAGRVRDLVSVQYQKGAASLLEFLDAQRTYVSTNVEYIQNLTGYWTAVFQLEEAVGKDLR
jgi:outer membrane protein, heavy metal efflux system